jgi:hypothetical protein
MTDSSELKSLKDEYRWHLWLIIAFNSIFLYAVAQENAIRLDGIRVALSNASNLIPVGFAIVAVTVVNGILSDGTKNRLVFIRWKYALPGHRAFSRHALDDPRINFKALQEMCGPDWPYTPESENQKWYAFYRTVENRTAIRQVHRDFLFLRDYTGLAALIALIYGGAGAFEIASPKIAALYGSLLIGQFIVVRHSACNYGISFVKNVLAQVTVSSSSEAQAT